MPEVIDAEGFALHRAVFSAAEIEALLRSLPEVKGAGVRSLLDREVVCEFARDARMRALVGEGAFAVRAILFDKDPEANWALGWHRDTSIAVRERVDTAGFGSWSVKEGVVHAIAPEALLERMVTLRVHLDACGAVAVKARSHLAPRGDAGAEQTCLAARGDVLAFKPLLLHASASSTSAEHRRVLQVEYASESLPGSLEWRWRV